MGPFFVNSRTVACAAASGLGDDKIREVPEDYPAPTAVFAGSDAIALGVMYQARDRGVTIPADLSLVGFGLYQWLSPSGPHWWQTVVEHTHPGRVSFTASLPAFGAAFCLAAVSALLFRRSRSRTALVEA